MDMDQITYDQIEYDHKADTYKVGGQIFMDRSAAKAYVDGFNAGWEAHIVEVRHLANDLKRATSNPEFEAGLLAELRKAFRVPSTLIGSNEPPAAPALTQKQQVAKNTEAIEVLQARTEQESLEGAAATENEGLIEVDRMASENHIARQAARDQRGMNDAVADLKAFGESKDVCSRCASVDAKLKISSMDGQLSCIDTQACAKRLVGNQPEVFRVTSEPRINVQPGWSTDPEMQRQMDAVTARDEQWRVVSTNWEDRDARVLAVYPPGRQSLPVIQTKPGQPAIVYWAQVVNLLNALGLNVRG